MANDFKGPDTLSKFLAPEPENNQISENESFAFAFLKKALRFKLARVDRDHFLRSQLSQAGVAPETIAIALREGTTAADIPPAVLDKIANSSINFETRNSSSMSFAAGMGGAATLAVALPGDVTQYYIHAFRIMQKLAYVYGWKDFIREADEVTDEVLGQFLMLLGVMMGVGGANNALRAFAAQVAPKMGRRVANQALTKTAWYPVAKQVLKQVGVKLTKDMTGKAVQKSIPVVGAFVGGSLTYVSLKNQADRLQRTLKEIPAPTFAVGQ